MLSKKADNLRGRIGASIRGQYGFSHMRLMQLGFRPHRGGIKLQRELADLVTWVLLVVYGGNGGFAGQNDLTVEIEASVP